MRQRNREIFPVFVGTDSLALVFCDMRVVLTVGEWPILFTFLCCFPPHLWCLPHPFLFRWVGMVSWHWYPVRYPSAPLGFVPRGLWICWQIWGSRCGLRQAIHDQVDFVEEPVVAQRYPAASIHSYLLLSVTMCLYDPPPVFAHDSETSRVLKLISGIYHPLDTRHNQWPVAQG